MDGWFSEPLADGGNRWSVGSYYDERRSVYAGDGPLIHPVLKRVSPEEYTYRLRQSSEERPLLVPVYHHKGESFPYRSSLIITPAPSPSPAGPIPAMPLPSPAPSLQRVHTRQSPPVFHYDHRVENEKQSWHTIGIPRLSPSQDVPDHAIIAGLFVCGVLFPPLLILVGHGAFNDCCGPIPRVVARMALLTGWGFFALTIAAIITAFVIVA